MSELSQRQPEPSTTAQRFGVVGLCSVAAAIVTSLLAPRQTFLKSRGSTVPGVQQWRRDVKSGKIRLFHQLVRSNAADIDDGIPVDAVNQYLRDLIEANEQYAERKARRDAAGVLPFRERLMRAAVQETQAEGAGNVATQIAECRPDDLEALRRARAALQAEEAPKEHLVAVLTEQIVSLEMRLVR